MPFRVSIRHTQLAGTKAGGWSENFWSQAGSIADAITATTTLRGLIYDMKGNQTLVPSARISAVKPAARQTKLVGYPGPATPPSGTNFDSDYPTSALLLKLTSNGGYETLQWMRGIPDAVVQSGGVYTPSAAPGFTSRLNKVLAELGNSSSGWSQYKLNPGSAKKPCTSLAILTGIITVPAHGFGAVGTIISIRVSGFLLPRGVNKVWNATILTGDTLQLQFYVPPTDAGLVPFAIQATARLQTKLYVQINAAEIVRATEHYTGRPTEVLGGRRRNRRRSRGGLPVDV